MSEPTEQNVRTEVRTWLEAHWDPDMQLRDWRELLADSGWGCPTWPRKWFGRGLPVAFEGVVAEEFRLIGAVGPPETTQEAARRRSRWTASTTVSTAMSISVETLKRPIPNRRLLRVSSSFRPIARNT